MVDVGDDILMASEGDVVSISDVHMDIMKKIDGVGECFTLEAYGDYREVPYCGWWDPTK